MPQPRWYRYPGRRRVLAALVALVPACGGGDGGGLTEPTTGAVQVTTSTTGAELDPDGYMVTLDDVARLQIGAAASRILDELDPGTHRLGLTGLSSSCAVQGDNPRTVTVVAGETAAETFEVACAAAPPVTGGLTVSTATGGVAPDADGYTVTVDGSESGTIGAEGSLAVGDLGAGDHLVGLAGVAANCAVEGDNPRTVSVVAGAVVPVAFSIACVAPPVSSGTLTITTQTGGAGADPNGYAFAIGDGAPQPIGPSATVSVAGVPAGTTQVELTGLAGNCQLAGANPRPVTVPDGGTVAVTFAVTCSAGTGTLVVVTESNGTPADPNGYTLRLDDEAAGTIGVNATRTLGQLPPGVHTVVLGGVADNCAVQGQSSRSATVTAAQTTTLTFTVVCAATTGSLTVTVAGLPSGAEGDVAVTGPGGFSRDVTATTTIAGLPPGDYTVTASSVTAGGSTWTASPATRTVPVAAGASATATVTYSAAPGATLNLTIAGMHLTQSVQTFDNLVPLVAGRDALLRVTALANGSNRVRTQVRVRLLQGNTEIRSVTIDSPADTVPTGRSDGVLTTTWNTVVPGSLVRTGLRAVAEVDPSGAIPEANENDNVFPAVGPLDLAVRNAPPLAITLVPVLQLATGLQGDVSAGNRRDYLDLASRMYPLPGYSANVRDVYVTSAPALQSDDANGGWLTVLSEIAALQAQGDFDRQFYGVVRVNYASGMAGLGFIGGPSAIGYDAPGDRARITAHELGHTWEREHAPCGNPSGPDPDFPYPGGQIGRIGWDPSTGRLMPRETRDVMGYCASPWISDYTYRGVMEFRGTALGRAAVTRTAEPSLLIWGRIVDGRAVLEPAFQVVARAAPARPGPYAVEGLAADGTRIFGVTFDAARVADHPRGARQFALTVPVSPAAASRLHELRLTGPGIAAAAISRPPAALRTTPADPVHMARTGGGVELRWDAAEHPMVMVRDARTGDVLSFARGGSVTLPAGGAELELVASDGVRSRRLTAAP